MASYDIFCRTLTVLTIILSLTSQQTTSCPRTTITHNIAQSIPGTQNVNEGGYVINVSPGAVGNVNSTININHKHQHNSINATGIESLDILSSSASDCCHNGACYGKFFYVLYRTRMPSVGFFSKFVCYVIGNLAKNILDNSSEKSLKGCIFLISCVLRAAI